MVMSLPLDLWMSFSVTFASRYTIERCCDYRLYSSVKFKDDDLLMVMPLSVLGHMLQEDCLHREMKSEHKQRA